MSWKKAIRPLADQVAKRTGLLQVCERRMRSQVTMLMYHRVLEDADCPGYWFPSLAIPRSLFEAQLEYLSERARVLPVSDALQQLGNTSTAPKPLVCLTFDDGYIDNVEIVAPLLESRGFRGTFFITAGAVRTQTPLWYDRAAAVWNALGRDRVLTESEAKDGTHNLETRESWVEWLKRIPSARREKIVTKLESARGDGTPPSLLMSSDDVRRLANAGHEIGSHTLSHPILTTLSPVERRSEIHEAKTLLEDWTQREVAGFCYPNGDFDAEVIRELREAGHTYACTTRAGRNHPGGDPFRLRRTDVTCERIATEDGRFDQLGFRSEICLLREDLRRILQPARWRSA